MFGFLFESASKEELINRFLQLCFFGYSEITIADVSP